MDEVIKRMQETVIALAREVERLYSNRCNITDLADCSNKNYNACVSRFPTATCRKNEELLTPACSNNVNDSCAALYDFNESNVVFSKSINLDDLSNPSNPQVRTHEATGFNPPLP